MSESDLDTNPQTPNKELSLPEKFVQECKFMGYEPTPLEIKMYFKRDSFRSAFPDGGVSDWRGFYTDPRHHHYFFQLTEVQSQALATRLADYSREAVMGNPEMELTTHLFEDFVSKLNNYYSWRNDTEMNDLLKKAIKTRNVFVKGGKNAIMYLAHRTAKYNMDRIREAKGLSHFLPANVYGRIASQRAADRFERETDLTFGIGERIDLETYTSFALMAAVQIPRAGVEEDVIKAIAKLYKTCGLDRYGDDEVARKAFARFKILIEPILPDVTYTINKTLGPVPRY
jgi:hypothetical protein